MDARQILLLIDVEPDARKTRTATGGWDGSRDALALLTTLRNRLEDATRAPVTFNWFLRLDPQIRDTWGRAEWVAEACPEILRTIADRGDASGIHPHLWRRDTSRGDWFNQLGDPAWTRECFETAADAFRRLFGRRPETCRFGDRWLDQDAVDLMRRSGIRYDFTIEPGLPAEPIPGDPHATAWLPDYRRAPRVPYRPGRDAFLVADCGDEARSADDSRAGGLWMFPTSTTAPAWRLMRSPPYLRKASRSPNLSLGWRYVWRHVDAELRTPSAAPLTLLFRTGDVATPRFRRNFAATTTRLLAHPALAACRFVDPPTALARWLSRRDP